MIYKLVTRVIQYFCFSERPMKGGDILDFQKGGIIEKGEYNPPYQLCFEKVVNVRIVDHLEKCSLFF